MAISSAFSLCVLPPVRGLRLRGGCVPSRFQRSLSQESSSRCTERTVRQPISLPGAETGVTASRTAPPESGGSRSERPASSHASATVETAKQPLPCPSLRTPYRDFLRACAKTFGEDFQARFYVTKQMTQLLRANPFNFPPSRLAKELKDAADFVRFKIIQAQLNPATGAYKAVPTDDHIRKGDVIELNCYDPEKMKTLPWLTKKPGGGCTPPPPEAGQKLPPKPSEAKF